jgi:hypothetical protein
MTAVVVGLVVVTALLSVLVVGLLKSHGEILRALHDLGAGLDDEPKGTFQAVRAEPPAATATAGRSGPSTTPLPDAVDISGTTPDGAVASVAVSGVAHHTLLCFLTTGCDMCHGFWDALADPAARAALGADTRVVAVTQDERTEMRSAVMRLAPPDVTTIMSTDAWDAYNVPVAPFFVLVDGTSGRVVGEGAAPAFEQLVDLLGRAATDRPGSGSTPRRSGGQRQREEDTDEILRQAGIEPGDPRLHHQGIEAGAKEEQTWS